MPVRGLGYASSFSSSGGGGGAPSGGGGGVPSSLDLSSFFNFLTTPSGGAQVAADQAVKAATRQLSAWSQRIAQLKAANDAEDLAIDQAQAAAAANQSTGDQILAWITAHRNELLLAVGVIVALKITKRK